VANRSTESAQPPEPPAPSSQPPPDTPPVPPAPATTTKKKAAQSRKKGRNQYTKDRDNDHEDSPARTVSRDASRNADEGGANNPKTTSHEGAGKHGKGKGGMNSRITMSDMKRRVNGILEFITRKQVELAGDSSPDSGSNSSQAGTEDGPLSTSKVNGDNAQERPSGGTPTTNGAPSGRSTNPNTMFKDLSCVEMMDVLTRDLVKWQQEFVQ